MGYFLFHSFLQNKNEKDLQGNRGLIFFLSIYLLLPCRSLYSGMHPVPLVCHWPCSSQLARWQKGQAVHCGSVFWSVVQTVSCKELYSPAVAQHRCNGSVKRSHSSEAAATPRLINKLFTVNMLEEKLPETPSTHLREGKMCQNSVCTIY